MQQGYEDNTDLPGAVQSHLSPQAQDVYRFAYNSAIAEGFNEELADNLAMQSVGMLLQKYTPDQPREPAGNPEGGRFTAYHGTAIGALHSILKNGITVQRKRNFEPTYYEGERGQSVYVTRDIEQAAQYAMYAQQSVEARGGVSDMIVVRVKVPKNLTVQDEHDDYSLRVPSGHIKPEWITGYRRPAVASADDVEWAEEWQEVGKQDTVTVYMALDLTEWEDIEKYSPDQARKPKGSPEGGRFVHHGTVESVLASIMREGLVPGRGSAEDLVDPDHPISRSVYVADTKGGARAYAETIADERFEYPVVLTARLPDSVKLLPDDEHEEGEGFFRIEGTIKPEWIVQAEVLEDNGWKAIPLKDMTKGEGRLVYIVIDLNKYKKYTPTQPREPEGVPTGGRWVRGGSSGDREELDALERDKWPEHIQALKVPPAWTNVFINPDPDGELLVVGQDSKGRLQYVYSDKFAEGQMRAKFERIRELDKEFEGIRNEVDRHRNSADVAEAEVADVTALIMDTGIRPGSERDRGGAKKAYGATTLLGQHVMDDGSLAFTGKKGIDLNIPVTDKKLAKMLMTRAKEAGPSGRLFPNTSDTSLREYVNDLNGGSFSPKDFRTYVGTSMARSEISKVTPPSSFAEYKKAVKLIGTSVSVKLGNTPTIALQSYIDPHVFSEWRTGLAIKFNADLHFGEINDDDLFDWRKVEIADPDDEETETPADVIAVLGFDPKD